MEASAPDPHEAALRRAFQRAYGLGLVLCVCWPLILQLLLGPVIKPGQAPPAGVVQQLGYTFTGHTFLAAAFVPGTSRHGYPPSRIVPPLSSMPSCSLSMLITGCGACVLNSVEFAPNSPSPLRAYPMIMLCRPRHAPC